MAPMRPMMIRFISSLILLLLLIFNLLILVDADSPHLFLDWTVSISQRAPLGVDKQVIVINDQFPGPLLNVTTNDVVNINIHNNLTEPFLMTWNGIQQRKNSWQDGVQGTNCPIMPGQNWTYSFQVKDQIGSFFYFPSLLFQKAAGGYGAIRVNNHPLISTPFLKQHREYDILIGDWYNADYRDLRGRLDNGSFLPLPDGILINGLGPNQANVEFEPGATYRLRISNVGLKTTLNFRIQDHVMQLVEIEGSYTQRNYYDNLDIHVGQSYSVLVTAKNTTTTTTDSNKFYYMVATSRFIPLYLYGVQTIRYINASYGEPSGPIPTGPLLFDYQYSADQAQSMKWDLSAGSARPNPQGSFHYGSINITRTIILKDGLALFNDKLRYTVNGVSFVSPDTPLKLADYFQLSDVFEPGIIPDTPDSRLPALGVSVIDAVYHDFVHVVFQNPLRTLQTWHADGHNFFVVGMGFGPWDESKMENYNMVDALSRSTVQVYPMSWTAILIKLDNQGLWNLRSQDAEKWYLGEELYIRVKGVGRQEPWTISSRDEAPIPENAILCGRAA